jgi:hypothetical protein
MSSFTAPGLTQVAQADPMTGTAMVGSLGLEGSWGRVKAYGRSVSNSFHAAGAQVRTEDANYEFLSPLIGEMTQVSNIGQWGVGLGLPKAPEQALNGLGIIAPGSLYTQVSPSKTYQYAGAWSHLLPYNMLNDISPYGMATPNRTGFGVEAEAKIFGGILVPKAVFDMATASSATPVSPTSKFWVTDNLGNTFTYMADPMSYQRVGAGLDVNFRLFWKVKVSGGYTLRDTRNGQNSFVLDSSGQKKPFVLTSSLLQGGVEVHNDEGVGVAVGYQHLDANGFSDVIKVSTLNGTTWDQYAYCVWWYITENARVDILYENMLVNSPGVLNSDFQADQGLVRFQVKF